MQRVYGEIQVISGEGLNNIVQEIKDYEISLDLNPVPDKLVLRKLGIKVDTTCDIAINGRDFSVNNKEPLEFGYDSIKIDSIIFKTAGVNAVIRYMYFREDMRYQ